MAGAIDRATLDRLIALGRERGDLTASEFQAALPVERLDVDALVMVMLALEEAGVSVEPDAFGPRTEAPAAPGFTLATREPGMLRPSGRSGDGKRPLAASQAVVPAEPLAAGQSEPVGRVVLLAGLAVLLILGTILVLV